MVIMNTIDFSKCDTKTPMFSLNGMKTLAKVTKVHDGDTIHCVIPVFNQFFTFIIRLNRIDTAELKSKNLELHKKGQQAKERLMELIGDYSNTECLVFLECLRFDKYGRVLAEVYTPDRSINLSEVLLSEKLGYLYTGGTKLTEEDQTFKYF